MALKMCCICGQEHERKTSFCSDRCLMAFGAVRARFERGEPYWIRGFNKKLAMIDKKTLLTWRTLFGGSKESRFHLTVEETGWDELGRPSVMFGGSVWPQDWILVYMLKHDGSSKAIRWWREEMERAE